MSLFASYIKEREGKEIVETAYGFATYLFPDANTCYIQDLYIHPDHRRTNLASEIADQIVEIARQKGCTELLGSVVPSTKNSTTSLKVLLGYGFQLKSASSDFIVFSKEIA